MRICAISDCLLAIGNQISERDQIYVILQVLPVEHNPFIMMIYRKGEPTSIYNVEALIYDQEAQLDKFKQEQATPSATANLAQCLLN